MRPSHSRRLRKGPLGRSGQNAHKRYELTVSQTSQIIFTCAWEDYFSLLAPARKKESKSDPFCVLGSTGELPTAPILQPRVFKQRLSGIGGVQGSPKVGAS